MAEDEQATATPVAIWAVAVVLALLLVCLVLLMLTQHQKPRLGSGSQGQNESGTEFTMGATGSAQSTGNSSAKSVDSKSIIQGGEQNAAATEKAQPLDGTVSSEKNDRNFVEPTGIDEDAKRTEFSLPLRPIPKNNPVNGSPAHNLTSESGRNPLSEASGTGDVVYVIDFSSSMTGEPLERVKRSLIGAIQELEERQQFAVLFFSDSVFHGPNGEQMVTATATAKRDMTNWIQGVFANGGTNPTDALRLALSLKPDRIVVLSDGEFDPRVVDVITQANHLTYSTRTGALIPVRRSIRIDCIGLTEQIQTLQDLAKRNANGIYYQAR